MPVSKKDMKVIAGNYADLHYPQIQRELRVDLIDTYYDLVHGTFGEVREESKGEFQTEIPAYQSKTGNPIIFEFNL